jgi:hypothetical protein
MAIWEFLNGKKTTIGAIAGVLVSWALARGVISAEDASAIVGVLSVWVGGAIIHHAAKGKNQDKRGQ